MFARVGILCYIDHSGKLIEINCNMKIPFTILQVATCPSLPQLKHLALGFPGFSFTC